MVVVVNKGHVRPATSEVLASEDSFAEMRIFPASTWFGFHHSDGEYPNRRHVDDDDVPFLHRPHGGVILLRQPYDEVES